MKASTPALSGFPTRTFEFDDLRLAVGHRLQLEIPGAAEPVSARLLGYLKGETLMVKLVNMRSVRREPLHEGDEVDVRGFSGRIAFSFKAPIEKIRYAPYAYFHLQFPEVVQGTEIRHSERVRVNMPVKVAGIGGNVAQSVEAAIANISSAGAMLVSSTPLGGVGDRVSLMFRFWVMPNDYEVNMQVASAIQTISASEGSPDQLSYGVRFEGVRSTEAILLQNLIYQRLQEGPDASV